MASSMEETLTKNLCFVTQKLSNVLLVLLKLLEKKIISQDEFDTVRSKSTNLEQNTELILMLKKKSEEILHIFLEILRETGNQAIAQKIDETSDGFQSVVGHSSKDGLAPLKWQKLSNANIGSRRLSEKLLEEKWWPERKILVNKFYDRKDNNELITEKLYSLLHENENKTTVITQDTLVVSGLGGIGKTSIAKSFAMKYEAEYNHIIWIDCGEGSLHRSFQSLARDLDIKNRSEMDLTELARKSFVQLRELKCLIIYDNAEGYIGNEGIRDVLPKCENGNLHSIITSRNQEWGTKSGYGKITKFCMNVFSTDDTVQFLTTALNETINVIDSDLSRLGDLLGHLPLALQIAAATLNNQQIPITEYIEKIAADYNSDFLLNENFDDYERTINKTMKISLEQIKSDENGKTAYTILISLGYLQPDDVEFFFLGNITNLKKVDVKNSIFILTKYSLVTVENKHGFDYVNIHRLLQQVIRQNGKDNEKEVIRKILWSKGKIEYKLIPYTFAVMHDDLKEEFTSLKAQLIDQVKLTDLLAERRFGEAADLALIIHNTFDLNRSERKYLLSKYNYAVCLEKGGRKNDAAVTIKSLYEYLGNEEDKSEKKNRNLNWSRDIVGVVWTIDDDNTIQFYAIPLNQKLRAKLIIKSCIHLYQKHEEGLLKCYMSCTSHLETLRKETSTDKTFFASKLILLLRLGLITANKIVLQHHSQNRNNLLKLFYVALRLVFMVDYKLFQEYSSKWEGISQGLQNLIGKVQTNQTWANLEGIIDDLREIITNGNNDYPVSPNIMAILATYLSEDDDSHLQISNPPDGEFKYTGTVFESSLGRIPHPELLTSVTLEAKTISMPNLQSSIESFVNLKSINIKAAKFYGDLVDKIELPQLSRFEIRLTYSNSEFSLSNIVDYYTFFCERDSCIWKSIRSLNYYSISDSQRLVIFDRDSQTVTFEGVSINKYHNQLSFLNKLIIKRSGVLIKDNVTHGCCNNCSTGISGNLLTSDYVDRDNTRNLKHFELHLIPNDYVKLDLDDIFDYHNAFRLTDSCFWKYIKTLDCFIIRKGGSLILFDKESQKLTLIGMSIKNCHYQLNYFNKLYIDSCTIVVGKEIERRCGCTFCKDVVGDSHPVVVDNSCRTSLNSVAAGQMSNGINEEFNTNEIKIKDSSCRDIESNKEISITPFILMFNQLKYLNIDQDDVSGMLVDLFGLDYIDIIEIRGTRVQCSRSTANSSDIISHQISKSCKKLTLNYITPVNDEGDKVDTIDFFSLNIAELNWNGMTDNIVIINLIQSGLKKLRLINVALECEEETNMISEHSNCLVNIPSSLYSLIMEYSAYDQSKTLKLDLKILPHSLKTMELNYSELNLTGEILPLNPLHLEKLIIHYYKDIDFETVVFQSLLHRTDNVVIISYKVVDLEKVVNSFTCNVKSVYSHINKTSEYLHYVKLDNSKSWKMKEAIIKSEITKEVFDEYRKH